jgi:hypothetical protein
MRQQYITSREFRECIKVIKENVMLNDANVNARNNSEFIPLNSIFYNDDDDKNVLKIIKILVDAGSELNNIDGLNGGILGHLLVDV